MEGTIAPEQIIINGQEYNPEDASSLIELGNKYREIEKNLNTSLDKVYPEYTKATQKVSQYEKELSETRSKLEEFEKKQKEVEVPQDRKQALAAARELGLADTDYLTEQGYVKKSDLDSYFAEKQTQQQAVDNVLKQAKVLEDKIDGSDGRVPFDQKAVLAYANAYNIADLEDAYKEMNGKANKAWEDRQIQAASKPGLTTLRPGGTKTPEPVKVTDDNFKQILWQQQHKA